MDKWLKRTRASQPHCVSCDLSPRFGEAPALPASLHRPAASRGHPLPHEASPSVHILASDPSKAAQAPWPQVCRQPHLLDSRVPSWVPTILCFYVCVPPFTLSFQCGLQWLAMQQGSPPPPPLITAGSRMVSSEPVGGGKESKTTGAWRGSLSHSRRCNSPGEFSPGWLFTGTEAVES